MADNATMSVDAFVSSAGRLSRRNAKTLIRGGGVAVNGVACTQTGTDLSPGDMVVFVCKGGREASTFVFPETTPVRSDSNTGSDSDTGDRCEGSASATGGESGSSASSLDATAEAEALPLAGDHGGADLGVDLVSFGHKHGRPAPSSVSRLWKLTKLPNPEASVRRVKTGLNADLARDFFANPRVESLFDSGR